MMLPPKKRKDSQTTITTQGQVKLVVRLPGAEKIKTSEEFGEWINSIIHFANQRSLYSEKWILEITESFVELLDLRKDLVCRQLINTLLVLLTANYLVHVQSGVKKDHDKLLKLRQADHLKEIGVRFTGETEQTNEQWSNFSEGACCSFKEIVLKRINDYLDKMETIHSEVDSQLVNTLISLKKHTNN